MGTITGIGDLDPARWPNSHWRSVKVNHLKSLYQVLNHISIFGLHFGLKFLSQKGLAQND